MTNQIQKKQIVEKGGISPIAAAVAGMVVGAGVAVAGAVALSDEKNRKNIRKTLTNMKDQATDFIEDNKKHAQDKRDEVGKKIFEGKEKIEHAALETEDSLHLKTKAAIKDAAKSI